MNAKRKSAIAHNGQCSWNISRDARERARPARHRVYGLGPRGADRARLIAMLAMVEAGHDGFLPDSPTWIPHRATVWAAGCDRARWVHHGREVEPPSTGDNVVRSPESPSQRPGRPSVTKTVLIG